MQTKDGIPAAQDPRLSRTEKDFPKKKKSPKTVVILRKALWADDVSPYSSSPELGNELVWNFILTHFVAEASCEYFRFQFMSHRKHTCPLQGPIDC